jgi:hypothetical protein
MIKKVCRLFAYFRATLGLVRILLYIGIAPRLAVFGGFLMKTDDPTPTEAVGVLSTGVEYYRRLIEAAWLFREGYAGKVVINGNRKTKVPRELKKQGFTPGCPWYENSLRILPLLGVPRDRVMTISAEDVYDTVSESEAVGKELLRAGMKSIILTTSKSRTRRQSLFGSTIPPISSPY